MFPNSKPCSVFLFGSGTVKTFPIAFRASLNTIEKCCNVVYLVEKNTLSSLNAKEYWEKRKEITKNKRRPSMY